MDPITSAVKDSSHDELALQPQEKIIIDSDGDLILVVGDEEQAFMVSSKILTMASTVFASMLAPVFKEGRDFAKLSSHSTESYSLMLPEDNAEAFEFMLRIIHFRPLNSYTPPPVQVILDFAIIGDKYNCVAAVATLGAAWVGHLAQKVLEPGNEPLLTAAYLFDGPSTFKTISSILLNNYSGSFLDFSCRADQQGILPGALFLMLEAQRTAAWTRIVQTITSIHTEKLTTAVSLPTDLFNGKIGYRNDTGVLLNLIALLTIPAYQRILAKKGIWPINMKTPIASFMERLNAINDYEIMSSLGNYAKPDLTTRLHSIGPFQQMIQRDVDGYCAGLCLDCVKAAARGVNESSCRLPHKECPD